MRVSISLIVLGLALGVALIAGSVQGQTDDHLKCYQIKGDLKLKGLVDIETPQFGLDPDCKITKAKLFCVPATKSNVDVVGAKTKDPVTPLPLSGRPAPGDRVCWQVKCPGALPADQMVTDQFGTQNLTKFKTKLLCTLAVKGTEFCGDGTVNGSEVCEPADDSACPGLCQADCSCGVAPPTCGNGVIDGNDDCDDPDLGGSTCESLGFASGTLTCSVGCGLDVSGCVPMGAGTFPATGQMTCWDSGGSEVACAGTDHDGEIQAGATLSYVDNGDGTITDLNTGLMWEKKSDDGTIHDQDTNYSWDNAFAVHAATLNSSTFAGHTDWRVPNRKELESILDLETSGPSVDPVFNTGCVPACTVTTCSCTLASLIYWSSTSSASAPSIAWAVEFITGSVAGNAKTSSGFVRAVRGGL